MYHNFSYLLQRVLKWVLYYVVPEDRFLMEKSLFWTEGAETYNLVKDYLSRKNPEYVKVMDDYAEYLGNLEEFLNPGDFVSSFIFSKRRPENYKNDDEQLCEIKWHDWLGHEYFEDIDKKDGEVVKDQYDSSVCLVKFCE